MGHNQYTLRIHKRNTNVVKPNTISGKMVNNIASHRLRRGPCHNTGTNITIMKREIAAVPTTANEDPRQGRKQSTPVTPVTYNQQ